MRDQGAHVWDGAPPVQAVAAGVAEGRLHACAEFVQVVVALGLIIGGAELFVGAINDLAELFGISQLVFALLVAPIATELPEKFNSVIWVRRRKDMLALGNMTGAMVFQSSFPVAIGLLLTPWHLEGPAWWPRSSRCVAGAVLWLRCGSGAGSPRRCCCCRASSTWAT